MSTPKDCNLYVTETAAGTPVQVLVPFGADLGDSVRRLVPTWGGAKPEWQCVVLGSALARWREVEAEPKPGGEEAVRCENVYQVYPRKVANPAALRAIARALKRVSYEVLLERTAKYAECVKSWPECDKVFIPNPTTFFNQERYNDEMITWKRMSVKNGKQQVEPDHAAGFAPKGSP